MNGILFVDKAAGFTSHDVVARVRGILHQRRVGHTGTLDPFATGLLVMLVGSATRLAQFLTAAEKEYEAVIRLGFATDTGDLTGTPLPNLNKNGALRNSWSDREVEIALQTLCGEIIQVPPMYSAKKLKGRKLYELARRGEEIERQPVSVQVRIFDPLRNSGHLLKDNGDGTVDLGVRVVCSAGTYIRTLAEDCGRLLGIGAHLAELRRTRAGDFLVKEASTVEQLKAKVDEGLLRTILIPSDAALSRMPFVHLSTGDVQRVRNGIAVLLETIQSESWSDGEQVKMRDEEGSLIAIGDYHAERQLLQPRVVLAENRD